MRVPPCNLFGNNVLGIAGLGGAAKALVKVKRSLQKIHILV
jgi:hypothetical protein